MTFLSVHSGTFLILKDQTKDLKATLLLIMAQDYAQGRTERMCYLHEHVADVFVASLRCSVERSAFVLRIHLEVRVDTVHWRINTENVRCILRKIKIARRT